MRRLRNVITYCFGTIIMSVIIIILSRNSNGFADWYGHHIFPVFPVTLGKLFSPIPFSVMEIGICTLLLVAAAFVIYSLSLLITKKRRSKVKKVMINALCIFLVFASTGFLILTLTCTVNYGRESFASYAGLQVMPSSKEELLSLCNVLIADTRTLSEKIPIDRNGHFTTKSADVEQEAKQAMKALGAEYNALSGYYPNPKPISFSKGMSMINLTGIYSPFTMEANYNDDVADYVIPFTICHELAHLKGFIREDEANFIAYLACMKSDSASLQYSGTVNALAYALNAYYQNAEIDEYQKLRETIPEQVRRDLQYNRDYWKQYDGRAAQIADKANDRYLKVNAQADGVKSYGRVVDLLIAEYRIGAKEV